MDISALLVRINRLAIAFIDIAVTFLFSHLLLLVFFVDFANEVDVLVVGLVADVLDDDVLGE